MELNVVNGMIIYEDNCTRREGCIANYICNDNFTLNGSNSRTCMASEDDDTVGVWSGTALTCSEGIGISRMSESFTICLKLKAANKGGWNHHMCRIKFLHAGMLLQGSSRAFL